MKYLFLRVRVDSICQYNTVFSKLENVTLHTNIQLQVRDRRLARHVDILFMVMTIRVTDWATLLFEKTTISYLSLFLRANAFLDGVLWALRYKLW